MLLVDQIYLESRCVNLITSKHVKKDSIVIDVGINVKQDNKLCGDVDFDSVSKVASYISPVPGGVGPLTVACLVSNTIQSSINNIKF